MRIHAVVAESSDGRAVYPITLAAWSALCAEAYRRGAQALTHLEATSDYRPSQHVIAITDAEESPAHG